MTKLSNEEYLDLIYILKEIGIRANHYKDEAKSTEEFLAYNLLDEKLDNLINKLDQIRIDQKREEYFDPLPFN